MFTYGRFMRIAGGLGLLFGAQLLLVPAVILGLDGITTDATGTLIARLCGGVLIEAGLTQVLIAGSSEPATQRRALLAGLVGSVLGTVVTVTMQARGIAGPMGWGNVAVYLFLFVGFLLTLRSVPEGRAR